MTRIGVCHYMTLPGTWEESVARAGELGFDGVELFVRSPFTGELLDHPERVDAIRAAASRAGVALPSVAMTFLNRDHFLSDADPAARRLAVARARLGIERCAELGGKVVLALGGPSLDDSRALDSYVQSLKELAATGARLGVRIGIETGYTADETLRVLSLVDSPWVGDYFDVGNAAGRGLDPADEIRRRGQHVVQMHVKGLRGAPLDGGTIDLEAFRRALDDVAYDGWLMVETSPGDDALREARRNLAVMRQHFS